MECKLKSNEPGYLMEEISKQQSNQAVTWLLSNTYVEMQEERNNLKMDVLIKKADGKDLESLKPGHVKIQKMCCFRRENSWCGQVTIC
jgi:hypothetical protein